MRIWGGNRVDLDFQNNLLRVWGYDENVSNEWLLSCNYETFWKEHSREVFFVSIFSQRIANPNDRLLDFLLTNRVIKKKISQVFTQFFEKLFENFCIQEVGVVDNQIILHFLSKEWIIQKIQKVTLEAGSENIKDLATLYIQELDMLMDIPQDFTLYCVAPQDFDNQIFHSIVYECGMYVWR